MDVYRIDSRAVDQIDYTTFGLSGSVAVGIYSIAYGPASLLPFVLFSPIQY